MKMVYVKGRYTYVSLPVDSFEIDHKTRGARTAPWRWSHPGEQANWSHSYVGYNNVDEAEKYFLRDTGIATEEKHILTHSVRDKWVANGDLQGGSPYEYFNGPSTWSVKDHEEAWSVFNEWRMSRRDYVINNGLQVPIKYPSHTFWGFAVSRYAKKDKIATSFAIYHAFRRCTQPFVNDVAEACRMGIYNEELWDKIAFALCDELQTFVKVEDDEHGLMLLLAAYTLNRGQGKKAGSVPKSQVMNPDMTYSPEIELEINQRDRIVNAIMQALNACKIQLMSVHDAILKHTEGLHVGDHKLMALKFNQPEYSEFVHPAALDVPNHDMNIAIDFMLRNTYVDWSVGDIDDADFVLAYFSRFNHIGRSTYAADGSWGYLLIPHRRGLLSGDRSTTFDGSMASVFYDFQFDLITGRRSHWWSQLPKTSERYVSREDVTCLSNVKGDDKLRMSKIPVADAELASLSDAFSINFTIEKDPMFLKTIFDVSRTISISKDITACNNEVNNTYFDLTVPNHIVNLASEYKSFYGVFNSRISNFFAPERPKDDNIYGACASLYAHSCDTRFHPFRSEIEHVLERIINDFSIPFGDMIISCDPTLPTIIGPHMPATPSHVLSKAMAIWDGTSDYVSVDGYFVTAEELAADDPFADFTHKCYSEPDYAFTHSIHF